MSIMVEGGYSIKHINSDEFIRDINDSDNIVTVGFFDKLFTKKGHCVSCGNKVYFKDDSYYKFRYEFGKDSDYWSDRNAFIFDGQCDCCGARYFNHKDELHYYIDDSIINLRKAKINTLVRKSKKWYKFK